MTWAAVVVGAGIGGMALAGHLVADGWEVTVVEATATRIDMRM